jgi:cation diffusion facilitator family transporter
MMSDPDLRPWAHDHTFGQDQRRSGETRTLIVIGITVVMMVAEIGAGIFFGSMALLADGLHMGSHASALAISALAYSYTRRHARDERFNFGTGKVNSLAAFASAVMLAIFALVMAGKSVLRFISPVDIGFNWAILVAAVGLIVNGGCLLILGGGQHVHAEPEHGEDHHDHDHGHQDQNLWSAYLHVAADAATSVLAIAALLGGKFLGQIWLDPFMGIVGAALVIKWSWGLLLSSAHVLLDMQAPAGLREQIRKAIEAEGGHRICDLHVWAVGPGIYAAEIGVVSANPFSADGYRQLLPLQLGIVHLTVQARACPLPDPDPREAENQRKRK